METGVVYCHGPKCKILHNIGGDLIVKVEGKSGDQKANTPRSKHSATEQRRRSKINDRCVFFVSR